MTRLLNGQITPSLPVRITAHQRRDFEQLVFLPPENQETDFEQLANNPQHHDIRESVRKRPR